MSFSLQRAVHILEKIADRLLRPIRNWIGASRPIQIVSHGGYGSDRRVVVRGRVLREPSDSPEPTISDSRWRNFRRMAGLWFTCEIPHAHLRATISGEAFEIECDDEGYFRSEVNLTSPPPEGWSSFATEVLAADAMPDGTHEGEFLIPPRDAEFGVISDIDDTIFETGATKLSLMLKTTLLGNEHTRVIFEGASNFYAALARGPSGDGRNPFFYVTSSPWNLHSFITRLLELRSFPRGNLFMTDWGIDQAKFLKLSHTEHKLAVLRELLTAFPDLPFVLIGDSGQHDPEIYAQAVKEFPGRIRAVYIRDVSTAARDEAVRAIHEATEADHEVDLLLCADTSDAAAHALANGLIQNSTLTPASGHR
ncbi:MAG: phosphatase domain-containing protein [Chthoniobacterales bacterium]